MGLYLPITVLYGFYLYFCKKAGMEDWIYCSFRTPLCFHTGASFSKGDELGGVALSDETCSQLLKLFSDPLLPTPTTGCECYGVETGIVPDHNGQYTLEHEPRPKEPETQQKSFKSLSQVREPHRP